MFKQCLVLFLPIIILIDVVHLRAQTVWNKTYLEDRPVMVFTGTETYMDSFFVIGSTTGADPNLSKGLVAIINQTGDLNRYQIIGDSSNDFYGFYTNGLVKTSNKLAFVGTSYSALSYLLFGIKDLSSGQLDVFRYPSTNAIAFQGYDLTKHGNYYYLTGARTDNNSNFPDVFLVKVDAVGNKLWEKTYGTQLAEEGRSIVVLPNGNLLLGAVKNDLSLPNEHANTWFLEVDTNGFIIKQWLETNDSSYAAKGAMITENHDVIFAAQKKVEQGSNVLWSATLTRMDTSFNKIWTFHGGSPSIYTSFEDILEMSDGSILACGNRPYFDGDSETLSGWVAKFSSQGALLWEKNYRGVDSVSSLNFLTDIDTLPGGLFVAVGQCRIIGSTHPQTGWMIKLDSAGCEMENCLAGMEATEQRFKNALIKLYPNPAEDYVTIEYESYANVEGTELVFLNAQGQQISILPLDKGKNHKIINIAFLPAGLYFIQKRDQNSGLMQTDRFVKE